MCPVSLASLQGLLDGGPVRRAPEIDLGAGTGTEGIEPSVLRLGGAAGLALKLSEDEARRADEDDYDDTRCY